MESDARHAEGAKKKALNPSPKALAAQLERRVLRGELRDSIVREKAARRARGDDLALTRAECGAQKERIQADCRAAREAIGARARKAVAGEKARRRELREHGAEKRGKVLAAPKRARMSRAENDSLAVHNLPPHLVDLFMELRAQFPYDLAPDHRAELFMEWAEAHANEVVAWQSERFGGDEDFAAEYARYLEQTA